jgi:hypothetical protein
MYFLSIGPGGSFSPDDLDILQRVFERACFLTAVPKRSACSDRLARFLIEEFRLGHTDESCLLECALWFAKGLSQKKSPPENWKWDGIHGTADE